MKPDSSQTETTLVPAAPRRFRRSKQGRPPGYRRTMFDMNRSLKRSLAIAAAYEGRPMVAIVEESLTRWLDEHGYELVEIEDNVPKS